MSILDNTYQENVFIETEATLNYDNGEWVNITDKINIGGKPLNKPTYVSVKNNGNVFIPHASNSAEGPFTDNPRLSWMFGLHIYDKPFGFKNLIVIPMVSNYPYLSDETDYKGKYGTYNGVLTGYQINGVHHKLINITCGDINVPFETINEDIIENSGTKRIFYNNEGNFGSYQIEKIYYYIPIKNENNVIEHQFIPSEEIKFYQVVRLSSKTGGDNSGGVSGDNSGSTSGSTPIQLIDTLYQYLDASEITPTNISNNKLYVQYNNKACLLQVDSYNGKTICTNNGMYSYRKTVDGVPIPSVNLNTFQYIELNDNTGNLIVSDGYGSDVEEVIDQYLSFSNTVIYETIMVGSNEQNYLVFDNDGDVLYDNLKLYSSHGGYIQCTEYKWNTVETEVDTEVIDYVYDMIREGWDRNDENRKADVNLYVYTMYIGDVEIKVELKRWFHPNRDWYEYLGDDNCYIDNTTTGYSSNNNRGWGQNIKVILGEMSNSSWAAYIEGDYLTISRCNNMSFITGDSNKCGYEGTFNINGEDWKVRFDYKSKNFQVYQPYTRSIKPQIIIDTDNIPNEPKAYINLLNNKTVEVNSNGTFTVNGYKYIISGYNDNILNNDPTNNLLYPLDDKNNIFKLVDKNKVWTNIVGSTELFTTDEDENKIHFQVENSNEYYFGVGYYQMEDGPQHIIYSPKYCVRQPEIICNNVENGSTNKHKYTFTINPDGNGENKYFKNYSFSWTCKFTKITTENTEYETESGILTPEDLKEGIYTIEIEIEQGFNSQPIIWELQDVTNLIFKDIEVKIQNNNTNV